MTISPLAGKPAPKEMLIDVARLEKEYFERRPDLQDPNQLVSFGTRQFATTGERREPTASCTWEKIPTICLRPRSVPPSKC